MLILVVLFEKALGLAISGPGQPFSACTNCNRCTVGEPDLPELCHFAMACFTDVSPRACSY